MAMNNLTIDGEFRYIIQWFNEWSELQRDDFVPVLVEYLLQGSPGQVYMNGIVNSVTNAGIQDKPMSLFQCRIKLFREWNKKWPLDLKHKLQEKIMEIDSKVADKITKEIKSHGGELIDILTNGCNGNETPIETEKENEEKNTTITAIDSSSTEAAEEAIHLDSQIVAVLNNETPVDDNITSAISDNIIIHTNTNPNYSTATILASTTLIDTQLQLEPAEQVRMELQDLLEENNIDPTNTATVA